MGLGDGTLGGGAVLGTGDGTLSCGDIVGDMVGRYFTSIFYRVLMACICSSTTVNGDGGAGLLSAFAKYPTAWSVELVEDMFGTRNLYSNNSTVLIILSVRVADTYMV